MTSMINNTRLKLRHPLSGIRVLDLTRVIAGPHCTMVLADLGADVIKVENPKDGDDARAFKPPSFGSSNESAFFLALNRNKRSITVDVGKPDGQKLLRALAAKSDVLIENFRTGVVERWGLDYESLRQAHPELVYCSISGYGRNGPLADRPGYDPVIQAECGLMWVNGHPDSEPVRLGVSLIDMTAGLYAAQAILAALYLRRDTGVGQRIDIPLFDTGLSMVVPYASASLVSGADPGRTGNASGYAQPVGLFQASDGPFILSAASEPLYRKLCDRVLDRPDLYARSDFATNEMRARNRLLLTDVLNAIFATRSRDSWIGAMRDAGIPAGPIRSVKEALASEEVAVRGAVQDARHATAGTVGIIASPMHFSETPVGAPVASPVLGEHTDEILQTVAGLAPAAIEQLRAEGIIGPKG